MTHLTRASRMAWLALATTAVGILAHQEASADSAKTGAGERPRVEATKDMTDLAEQRNLLRIAESDPKEDARIQALEKMTDVPMLAQLAKREKNLTVLNAALRRIKDETVLLEIARTARYKLTRRLLVARLDSHWRREVDLVSARVADAAGMVMVQVTLKNVGREFAYSEPTWLSERVVRNLLPNVDPTLGHVAHGVVEPGTTKTLDTYVEPSMLEVITRTPVLELRNAWPVLPNGAVDLTAGGLAPSASRVNHPPVINAEGVWTKKTSTDVVGQTLAATTQLHVIAEDPDGDALTYEWSVSNGEVRANRPIATWQRVVNAGEVEPGTITVKVSDGRGGRATRTFPSQ
jgi:hypothetical protein